MFSKELGAHGEHEPDFQLAVRKRIHTQQLKQLRFKPSTPGMFFILRHTSSVTIEQLQSLLYTFYMYVCLQDMNLEFNGLSDKQTCEEQIGALLPKNECQYGQCSLDNIYQPNTTNNIFWV